MLVSPSTAMDVLSYHLSDGRYNITQFHLKYWRETQLLGSELQPNGRHQVARESAAFRRAEG